MRNLWLALCAVAALCGVPALASAADASAPTARVIVKFKAGSSMLKAQSASGRETAQAVLQRNGEQAAALGRRHGMSLAGGVSVGERAQVVTAAGFSSDDLAQQLAQDADVEYALPDRRRKRQAAPNDPLYPADPSADAFRPQSGQWYLQTPSSTIPAAIDAENAWSITTGSASVVVALLDSGVRFDHADLLGPGVGNLLAGYDMITNPAVANDGDGRDADASDPGDWVSAQDIAQDPTDFPSSDCTPEDSSWHGTRTASLVAALTNNGTGMASVGRTVKVLPVRVLGKCGGFDSDILAGLRWAAGIDVAGVPHNDHPAQIISLSLGSQGSCSADYVEAMSEVAGKGVLVVASAGNDEGLAVNLPGNCPGVLAVAGLRHIGTKVGFSDIGPEVSLSAPAGNCINTDPNQPCLFPIITALNAGTTTPVANSSIYSDGRNISVGTSFSAPLVAGTAALMLSARPTLTASDLSRILKSTSTPFPTTGSENGSSVAQCHAPSSATQDECYCTTSTCGAGMLDAWGAVSGAAIAVSPASPQPGQPVTLDVTGGVLPLAHPGAQYAWLIADGGGIVSSFVGATDGTSASFTPSGAGRLVVQLAVTDPGGTVTTASLPIVVGATSSSSSGGSTGGSSSGGGGGGGAVGAVWLLGLLFAIAALRYRRRR